MIVRAPLSSTIAVNVTADVVGASLTGSTVKKPGNIELSLLLVKVKSTSPYKFSIGVKTESMNEPFVTSPSVKAIE